MHKYGFPFLIMKKAILLTNKGWRVVQHFFPLLFSLFGRQMVFLTIINEKKNGLQKNWPTGSFPLEM